jgi:tripartite ATP-independent transporter DctM subunit
MTDPEVGVMMLALFVFVIMLGFPIAFSLMAMGVGFAFYYFDFRDTPVFALVVRKTFEVMSNEVLLPVPLFLFMGYVVERAAILDKLFRSIQVAAGNIPAALAVATLVTCALFATATGIVGAVVTLMGLLAFPAMLRAGYDVKLSAGVICAGGCLGILIPPSIMLILYGATAGVSPVQLYAGAFLPGFMLAGLYMVYVMGRAIINPKLAPRLPKSETAVPFTQVVWLLLTSFAPLAGLIVAVLGAIIFGLATPSEAAAIGAAGALVLAVAYGGFSFAKLRESVYLTARTTAMVCWLFVGSSIFAAVFGLLGGQELIKDWMLALDLGPTGFMILVQVIIFLLGWPLEWTEIIVIFVPIFLPLLQYFQIDPLFFGLLVALNIQTSFLSPPVAMAAFYLKGVAPKHVTLNQIFAGMMPFMAIVIVAMALLYVFPGIGLWLPHALYGG